MQNDFASIAPFIRDYVEQIGAVDVYENIVTQRVGETDKAFQERYEVEKYDRQVALVSWRKHFPTTKSAGPRGGGYRVTQNTVKSTIWSNITKTARTAYLLTITVSLPEGVAPSWR